MVAQLNLFSDNLIILKNPNAKRRVRYPVPTYKKFYSVEIYDRQKFRQILNMKLKGYKCLKDLSQENILELCYKRDEYGKILYDSDEHHIFRYKILQKIHEELYIILNSKFFVFTLDEPYTQKIKNITLIFHPDEQQAEIKDSWQLPLGQRIKLHIKLLRYLRKLAEV